jgi:hypothetical protein
MDSSELAAILEARPKENKDYLLRNRLDAATWDGSQCVESQGLHSEADVGAA